MGPVPRLIVLLLFLVPLLSGCTTSPDGDDTSGDGNGTDGTGSEDGGDGTDGGDTPEERPQPVPPQEQRVDDPDDVDEPGEYALLPRADDHNDERWEVPSWTLGDTWVYVHQVPAGAMQVTTDEEVTGESTAMGVDLYTLTRTERDCDSDVKPCERILNITQSDLVEMRDNGYIEHTIVFPLEDGQRWVFARQDGRNGVTKVHAEARHVPDYLWPGTTKTVEAWRLILDYEGDGNVQTKTWLGVDQKNMLRREIWADSAEGVNTMHFTTTLESYTPG